MSSEWTAWCPSFWPHVLTSIGERPLPSSTAPLASATAVSQRQRGGVQSHVPVVGHRDRVPGRARQSTQARGPWRFRARQPGRRCDKAKPGLSSYRWRSLPGRRRRQAEPTESLRCSGPERERPRKARRREPLAPLNGMHSSSTRTRLRSPTSAADRRRGRSVRSPGLNAVRRHPPVPNIPRPIVDVVDDPR